MPRNLPDRPMPKEFPKVEFGRFKQYVPKLIDKVMESDLVGEVVQGEVLDTLTEAIIQGFGEGSGILRPAIYGSCTSLLRQQLTQPVLKQFIERLAANRAMLMEGRPVYSLSVHLPEYTWTCLEFQELKQQGSSLLYELKVVWGPLYGLKVWRVVDESAPTFSVLAFRLGVSSRRRPQFHPRQFIRLRMWGELKHRVENDRKFVTFARYAVDPQVQRYNAAAIKLRNKICPRGYHWPCHTCPAGYVSDPDGPCPRSCRRQAITQRADEPTSSHACRGSDGGQAAQR